MEKSTGLPPKISATVDLDGAGVQHGHLVIPHSRNDSPWGSILMPISVIAGGEGPTILFTGGNHGDEYEGPITLMNLVRELRAESVRGRVIVIPALNYPALRAGTRLSPIDGLNMNRVFPGRRDGSVTEMIADYVQRVVLPRADVVVDFHAGGKVMTFLPMAVMHRLPDPAMMERTTAALHAFGAPVGLVLEELDAAGMLDTAVEAMGKVFISTELGGGGTVSRETLAIARRGVSNLLVHFGLVDGAIEGPGRTRLMEAPGAESYVVARGSGLYEIIAEPGEEVREGDPVGRIHDPERPWAEPVLCKAGMEGLLVHRHVAGHVQTGDCLAVVARDLA